MTDLLPAIVRQNLPVSIQGVRSVDAVTGRKPSIAGESDWVLQDSTGGAEDDRRQGPLLEGAFRPEPWSGAPFAAHLMAHRHSGTGDWSGEVLLRERADAAYRESEMLTTEFFGANPVDIRV